MAFDPIKIKLANAQQGHQALMAAWQACKAWLLAGHSLSLEIRAETRSTAANRLLWSCLNDISRQVEWPVDGKMQRLDPDEWKDILSAGVTKAQRVAQGVEGGWVMLGQRTSKMSRAEFTALVDFAHAFGDSRGITWSRTSLGREWPEEEACTS